MKKVENMCNNISVFRDSHIFMDRSLERGRKYYVV